MDSDFDRNRDFPNDGTIVNVITPHGLALVAQLDGILSVQGDSPGFVICIDQHECEPGWFIESSRFDSLREAIYDAARRWYGVIPPAEPNPAGRGYQPPKV